ncbi:MAG: hypothetical protein ABFS32_19180, partial [Bacteroidota bacterium]
MNKKTWIILIITVAGFTQKLTAQVIDDPNAVVENTTSDVATSLEAQRQDIHNQLDFLKENNRFTEFLDLTTIIDFPVGIKKTIGNLEYVIAIDSIVMTPTYAYLNASMSFNNPETGDTKLAFRGTNIRFTSQGGLSGDARLELVGDYSIQMPGGKMDLVLKGQDTYVVWDCDGFKGFGLLGGINFSRDLLIPVSEAGEDIEGLVSANFSVSINDWNDFIASVTVTPFRPTKAPGFTFYASDAIFDLSDLRNPLDIEFPRNYASPFIATGSQNLWRGVFLRSVRVNLPSEFKSEEGVKPYMEVQNLLVDETGISGEINGQYIIPLDQGSSGSMSGWPFSLDKLEISFVSNKLQHSLFQGQIVLPVTSEQSTLAYSAFVDHQNNYFFNVQPTDSLEFDLWRAGSVTLYESSYIHVYIRNGRFVPEAMLNGAMSINAGGIGGEDVK